jgi:hypothetical protein
MRLYNKRDATQFDDPEHGTFAAGPTGAFDGLPDAMYAKLYGRPDWESEAQREQRMSQEELDKFRDPAELLKAVKEMGANQSALAVALASALGLGKTPDPPVAPVVPASAPVDAPPVKAEPEAPAAEPKSRGRGKSAASK